LDAEAIVLEGAGRVATMAAEILARRFGTSPEAESVLDLEELERMIQANAQEAVGPAGRTNPPRMWRPAA
jgi:hypothetical protein